MKRWVVWVPAAAGLALAVAAGCQTTGVVTGCDLKAASATAAEAAKPGCGVAWIDANVRINQLQSVGTHNSYKVKIPDVEMAVIKERAPAVALTLDYEHETLAGQLDKGARQIEIDPSDDPEGGRFATPLMRKILTERGITPPAYDLSPMKKPGIKVIHVSDIDYRSHCLLFVDCMKQIKAWSDAHPHHTPILLMINPKSTTTSWPGSAPVLPWGKEAFDRMDAEIKSVWPLDRIIKPDDVRGSHATLREAVMAGAWPTLGASRGKVIFAMDLSPEQNAPYAVGHPSLTGRVAFMTTFPDSPEAAYFTMNEPDKDQALIRSRVAAGFLIRTRADADTREARSGDTKRRELAFASGAQFVSTDYQDPDPRFGTGYFVKLPGGGVTRCDPVGKAACGAVNAE